MRAWNDSGLVAPDRQDLLVLDRSQQLGLRRPGQLADLVEEHSAPPCRDEQTVLIAIGAGIGTSNVAEKLVLEQVVRDRRTVHRQENFLRCGALRVQGASHQLLAGSRLAGHEHRRSTGRHFTDQRLHHADRRTVAHESSGVSLGVKLPS